MKMRTRFSRTTSALLAAWMLLSLCACGQPAPSTPPKSEDTSTGTASYPEQELTYMVCFAAGGESDVTARLQQEFFEKYCPVGFHIEYMEGGGGSVGWAELTNRENDGYTIAGCNEPHTIVQPMQNETGFTTDGFERICLFQYTGRCILVPADSPYDTLEDMVSYAKENPSAVVLGGSGTWSASHITCLEMQKYMEAEYTYVAYSGTGDAKADLLGGHIDGYIANVTEAIELGSQVKCLAVAQDARHEKLPDVPTFTELGYPIVEGSYRGVMAPKGTPDDVVSYLAGVFRSINEDPEFAEQMEALGFDLIYKGPDEYDQFLKERTAFYQELMEEFGN